MAKLIDQGGFGCVFYPGLNCKSKFRQTNNKLVSKIQLNSFNARNEVYIGSIILKIPNYKLYFLPVISECNLSIAQINQSMIDKCDIIEKDHDKYKVLELPYLENISFEKLFADFKRTTQHLFLTFIETYKYVAIAIGELIDKQIVHYDIKEQNILYSTKFDNPILIDFGISIPINKLTTSNLKEYFYTYSPDYYLWSIEIHIINYILHVGKLTHEAIQSTVEKYIANNSAFRSLSDEFKNNYSKAAIDFFTPFLKHDSTYTVTKLIEFYKTWDLYSLSIMYLKLLNKLFYKQYFKNSFIIAFSQLLLQNVCPNPNKRLSSSDTQKKYIDIFYLNEKPENYFILIKKLERESIITT